MYVCIHALYLYVYVHIIVYSPAVDASQYVHIIVFFSIFL